MTIIRLEEPGDIDAVRTVNDAAFEQPDEGRIVDALRDNCDDVLSLVAVEGDTVVGHILFSTATIACQGRLVAGMGLAPMAVLPGHQRKGIGTELVEHGLSVLRAESCPFVIVLGHPEYYPRFGFTPASRHGITCQWQGVPDEAFMALVIDERAMDGVAGVALYRDEFDAAM